MNPLSLSTYDYALPDELIAQFPTEPADSCRLLVYSKKCHC
jgi:S-adenosylmethionine:tRNA-ribosyltransferase-isomerase (queuine synthetase)